MAGLSQFYGAARPKVVMAVLNQALSLGAQFAIIERRYLDADYRSEHSRFYSSTYRRYPPSRTGCTSSPTRPRRS